MSESQQGPEIVTSLVESAIAQAIILRTLMRRLSLVSIRQTDISCQWLSQDISLFLHEIPLSLEISVHKSVSLFNF